MSKSFPPHTIFQWIFPGIFLTTILFAFSNTAFAATRTISNAGGNWDSTGTWVEAAVPTSADDVVATGTSGNVTINVAASARSVDLTGYVGNLTHNSAITLSIGDATAGTGNIALKFVAGMTYTLGSVTTSAINFISTSATQQTITTGGKTLGNWTINGAGSSYLLSDANTVGSTSTVTLTAGTLNTNGQTCSWGLFNTNNSNIRTLTLGASNITITGGVGNVWSAQTNTNLTIATNTATVTLSGAGVTFQAGDVGNVNWNGLSLVLSGSGGVAINGGKYANLTRTGTAAKGDSLILYNSPTVTGTLNLNGNSSTNRILVYGNAFGSSRTFTITGATVSASNVDFRDITLSVSTDLSAITGGSGNSGGNSGITFTTAATQTYTGGTGSWSDVTKWTSRVPLPQDDVVMSGVTGGTITADMPRLGKSIDWTGASGSPTWSLGTSVTNYGSLTLISGMTFSGAQTWAFGGRGSFTLTSAGKSFPSDETIAMVGGTLTLQDAASFGSGSTGNFTLANGTFSANGHNVGSGKMILNGTASRTMNMGSGTWTLSVSNTGNLTFYATTATNLTYNSDTSTLVFSNTDSSAKTLSGSLIHHNVSVAGGGSGAFLVTGSNTFNTLTIGAPKTVTFTSGTTQTVSNFVAVGTAGNIITINSSSGGSAATLSDTSGINIFGYCSIQDITVSGGASFKAYNNCTNVSGNTGWKFKRAPMMVR